jgi:hypothetical protein
MKLVAYDPKMLTVKSGPRMVPCVGERFLLGPQGEPIEVRDFNPDQPREPETGPQGEPLLDDGGEEHGGSDAPARP